MGIVGALIVPSQSWADNTDLMAIAPPAGGYHSDQYANPIFPTRALTFAIAYDSTYYQGDAIQCQLETVVDTTGSSFPGAGLRRGRATPGRPPTVA